MGSNLLKMKQSPTFCGDMGTESSLTTVNNLPIQQYFPHWKDLDFENDIVAAGGADVLDISSSLYIPGMQHVVDNMSKDLLNALPMFTDEMRDNMSAVASFFSITLTFASSTSTDASRHRFTDAMSFCSTRDRS